MNALALEFVGDRQHVAGRHHDDVGTKILDQLYLLFGLAAAERDHGQPRTFSAVMSAEATREQAIAIADVHFVPASCARSADGTRNEICPGVDVLRRVT